MVLSSFIFLLFHRHSISSYCHQRKSEMSRVIVAISFLFLSIYCPYVASDPDVNNTTSEIENLKNICEAADPVSLILQSDECIVDPVMKEVITGCRFVSYGSSDVSIATATFCSATDTLRREMDELFEVCLMEKGLISEMMQLEWAANCAFCQNIALVNKTEECFVSSFTFCPSISITNFTLSDPF